MQWVRKNEEMKIEKLNTIVTSKLLIKCGDLGKFSLPCKIGKNKFANAMVDLGASINTMLAFVFYELQLSNLNSSSVVVQLANSSLIKPLGIVKNVLINC